MYIDGFVASVPTDKKAEYTAFATRVDAIFIEHGATRVVDGWGDDVPHGQVTDFHRAVQATEGESVVFGYIEWPDKATRDAVWEKVMADPRMADNAPPFDGKRMIFGAFDVISAQEAAK